MKYVIFLFVFLSFYSTQLSQEKYFSKTGHIRFFGETPLETIDANNNQVATVINIKTGAIAFDVLIKSFKFKKALMEEHFNENYIHSAKYPKCTFSGKFIDFDIDNFTKDGTYKTMVEGDLTMHGVTKHIKQSGSLEVKDGKIFAKSKFNVKPEDFNIEIPGIVRDKIAKTMEVTVDITYEPFNK